VLWCSWVDNCAPVRLCIVYTCLYLVNLLGYIGLLLAKYMPEVRVELQLFGRTFTIYCGFELTHSALYIRCGALLIHPWHRRYGRCFEWSLSLPSWISTDYLPQPEVRTFGPFVNVFTKYDAIRGSFSVNTVGISQPPEYLVTFEQAHNRAVEEALAAAHWAKESSSRSERRRNAAILLSLPAGRNLIRLLSPYAGSPLLDDSLPLAERQRLAASSDAEESASEPEGEL